MQLLARCAAWLLLASCVHASRFVIMRHGETNHNSLGIIQGSSDVSRLTEQGLEQARSAGVALAGLADISINRVFVSPLTRAQQTLDACAGTYSSFFFSSRPPATVVPELREIDLGSWEGQDKKILKANCPDAYAAWQRAPLAFEIDGGTLPIVDLWARAAVAWEKMHEEADGDEDSAVLVVTHNALGQALLCTALELDETHFRKHEFANCAALEIDWPRDRPKARGWRWRVGPKAGDLAESETPSRVSGDGWLVE
jgi:broad specificity phosphatase PhoE